MDKSLHAFPGAGVAVAGVPRIAELTARRDRTCAQARQASHGTRACFV